MVIARQPVLSRRQEIGGGFPSLSVLYRLTVLYGLMVLAPTAQAELKIEVTRGVDNAVKVAVVPFEWRGRGRLPLNVVEVIKSDLAQSGRFDTLATNLMLSLPNEREDIYFRDWHLLGVEYLAIGYLKPQGVSIQMHFELYNVFKKSLVISQTIEGGPKELRDMGHHASDVIFEQLTGIEGAFATRIMYVTVKDDGKNRKGEKQRLFSLNIADADGHRATTVVNSREPILSASWAPDGKSVAYVSFEKNQRPGIYLHELATGKRQLLTSFVGLNGAPSFSPDGKSLALVLSKDGNPDIYVLDLETRRLRRVTRHYGIDTEPSWRPDGKALVFTSNRGGKPQIYQIRLSDFQIQRLTFEGDYNAKASVLRDGSGLVMVHRRNGIFHIALLELKRGRLTVLTETSLDESPSVAPNGSMLVYATRSGGKGILAAVSVDGGVKFNLPSSEGDVREPAWSPKKTRVFEPIL